MAAQQQSYEKSDMQKDINGWVARANYAVANPDSVTNVQGDAPWSSSFFECFQPVDTMLLSWCCPCIQFGRTHHRLHKDGNLQGWSPINGSCLVWSLGACFGLHCIANLMQRTEIRQRANPPLAGDLVTDCLKAWCCNCCDLVQQDKEALALAEKQDVVMVAPAMKTEQMSYPGGQLTHTDIEANH